MSIEMILMVGVVALAEMSLAYVVGCILVTWIWQHTIAATPPPPAASGTQWPSVAVLKPLCGAEPDLAANLRSFCDQAYPQFEIVMGARDANDAAMPIAGRVAGEAGPHVRLVSGGPFLGQNQKVNTLAHLGASTDAEVVVIADSDVRVDRGYLAAVVEPLLDPSVGVVTCVYRGAPTESIWSRLGALAINEWFLPAVLVSRALGSETYCSGSTMAMRRGVLDAIGGFEALAPLLADDHELGERIRRLGLRSIVSHYEVGTTVDEASLASLVHHELRWMRTIRTVQPLGHACSAVTYAVPMTLLATLFVGRFPWLAILPALAVAARLTLHWVVARGPAPIGHARAPRIRERLSWVWLVPLRDLLSFGIWIASFANRRVVWREQALHVRPDGVLRRNEEVLPA